MAHRLAGGLRPVGPNHDPLEHASLLQLGAPGPAPIAPGSSRILSPRTARLENDATELIYLMAILIACLIASMVIAVVKLW